MTRETLQTRLRTRLNDAQADWLAAALERARTGTTADLLRTYTDASQHLGRTPLATGDGVDDNPPLHNWTLEDAGRLLLLLTRHDHTTNRSGFAEDAIACYEQGDAREQQSWVRAVAWLPDAKQYLPLVIDTCRTNILPLFQAVACDNSYPAHYFPEANFNQMVLKALFNGVPLARINGLSDRSNSELVRMATDYAAERRAAGRSIPGDIALATASPQRTER